MLIKVGVKMNIKNKFWEEDNFLKQREEVLKQWPTGKEIDLEDAVEYQKGLDSKKKMTFKLMKAKQEKTTLIQPRVGVALPKKQIEILQYLEKEGEADVLSTTIDKYSRQNKYQEAKRGIEESQEMGRSMLKGFPAVNHGLKVCRKLLEAVDVPLQVRHGTPDARLLAEITLAAGFTDFEGGSISSNIPYAKDFSPIDSIIYWQYVDRLVGFYNKRGVNINRETFGPLTGTLVPPAISHSINIIESLLAAEQGVKYLSLGYGQNGNLIQDVAAIKTLSKLASEYLVNEGYKNVEVTTVFHQWLGGFPQDEAKSYAVINWGTTAAALSNATKIVVKTPHEASGLPSKEANACGLKTSKQLISMLQNQNLEQSDKLNREQEMIESEVKQILAKVLELGEGDWAQGTIKAFEEGILDIPFAPSKYNCGKVLTARDNKGIVRFLDPGNLPLSEEIKTYHKNKIAERGKIEGRDIGFQMVIDDLYAIGKGMVVARSGK